MPGQRQGKGCDRSKLLRAGQILSPETIDEAAERHDEIERCRRANPEFDSDAGTAQRS
jgi:hypothetical protein